MSNEQHWKATPALIIGLGGTGVRTLTHLKKDLITLNHGALPNEVRLLAFDTVTKPDVVVGGGEAGNSEATSGVRLEMTQGEYVHIGGDIKPYVRDVAMGKHPHVEGWLQAAYYLETLPDSQFYLEKGAGMLRQFGRAGIFDDVKAPGMSKIYTKLLEAVQHVQNATNAETIEVAIVASTAGGTGAGMLVDIAHLVRQIASKTKIRLRGYLVLPEAFEKIPSGITRDMKARSYAALRETRRFMVNFDWVRGYPMFYHNAEAHHDPKDIWQGRIQNKLFDYMYVIDGRRARNNLSQYLPDIGIAPSIADMISAILDVKGGQKFTEHENNMNEVAQGRGGSLEKTANYGAMGTYTIVLPIYHIVEEFSHRLGLETLEAWLLPTNKADGIPESVVADRNQDAGAGKSGRDDALPFLRMTQVVDAHDPEGKRTVSNTRLMPEIARIAQRYSPDNPGVVSELVGRNLQGWLDLFIPPGDNPEVEEIRRQVNAILSLSLETIAPTSNKVSGEKPADGLRRIEDTIRTFKARHLGGENFEGRRDGGDYRQALERLAAFHQLRFQQMLNYQAGNILNGLPQTDAVRAKSGRLGYLRDLLAGLEKETTTFLGVMTQVRDQREQRGIRRNLLAQTQGSLSNMKQKATSWVPGQAVGAQRDYIAAEQRLVDALRQEILEDLIRSTASYLLAYAKNGLQVVDSWLNTLVVGNTSLYAQLLRGQKQLQANREDDKKIKVREIIDDKAYESGLYQQYTQNGAVIAEIMNDLTWSVTVSEAGASRQFDLQLTCQLANEKPSFIKERRQDNQALFLRRTAQSFTELKNSESCLKYLKKQYTGKEADLGKLLADRSGLVLNFERAVNAVPANYLRIHHGEQPDDSTFLADALRAATNETGATGKFVAVVQSADRYKCTLVYTVDMIPLDNISSYRECEGDYKAFHAGQKGGRRQILHLFPAEVNAVGFEERLGELGENPRLFNDQVVVQLEDIKTCRLFANCLAYRLVERDRDEDGSESKNYYALKLPSDNTNPYAPLAPISIRLTPAQTGDPDLLQAMGQFNYEGHDISAQNRDPNDPRTIDYDRVKKALQEARQRIGDEQGKIPGSLLEIEETALRGMDPESSDAITLRNLLGQRHWLRMQQERLLMPLRRSNRQIDKDLSTVLWLMFQDEIRSLNVNIQQKTMYYAQ
ncbi:MAG: hypothetical protein H6656_17050 [Ardenticatenaceae bacterium]|nr:hypothetical protein [Ardenticatenaceae bacterium]